MGQKVNSVTLKALVSLKKEEFDEWLSQAAMEGALEWFQEAKEIRGTGNQEHIPLVQQVRRYLLKRVKVPFAHISSRVASIFKRKKKQSNA